MYSHNQVSMEPLILSHGKNAGCLATEASGMNELVLSRDGSGRADRV